MNTSDVFYEIIKLFHAKSCEKKRKICDNTITKLKSTYNYLYLLEYNNTN